MICKRYWMITKVRIKYTRSFSLYKIFLAAILLVWLWHVISQKCKNCEFLPSNFQCKNWLAILHLCDCIQNLGVVLPFWPWQVISQKWHTRLDFVIITHTFCDQLKKIVICYLQICKVSIKNWPTIIPLCDGIQNLSVVIPVWLWRVISQKWPNLFYFVSSAPKYWFYQILVINCKNVNFYL